MQEENLNYYLNTDEKAETLNFANFQIKFLRKEKKELSEGIVKKKKKLEDILFGIDLLKKNIEIMQKDMKEDEIKLHEVYQINVEKLLTLHYFLEKNKFNQKKPKKKKEKIKEEKKTFEYFYTKRNYSKNYIMYRLQGIDK